MKACKRIEIVIEEPLARRMADRLDELGAPGYTMIPRASGRGGRGKRRGDDPTGMDTNCVFVLACEDPALAERIVKGVGVLLARNGGVCLVSDALIAPY